MDYMESPTEHDRCDQCGVVVHGMAADCLCDHCRVSLLRQEDFDAQEYDGMPPEHL